MENQPTKPSTDEKDIDLGVLFVLFTRIAKKLLSILRQLVDMFVSIIIWILLLIRRKIWWLLGAIVLGILPGLYNYLSLGREYYSAMTVRANYGSVHNLYNKIDYFNGLIKSGDNKKLSGIFHISPDNAGQLVRFEINAIDDQLQEAEVYKKYFYNTEDYARIIREGQTVLVRDSSWSTLIRFKDFRSRLTPYDFPFQTVRVYSRSAVGYGSIQAGLLAEVNANDALRRHQQITDSTYQEQSNIIHQSISNVDTLIHAFGKSIATGSRADNANFTLTTQPSKSPTVEIFDQAIRLKDELGRINEASAANHDILQVYADFNDPGVPVSPFKESFMDYSLWCLMWVFVLLLVLEAYKAIDDRAKPGRNA